MGKSFVEEAPILMPSEIFQSEGAGPSRKPLGRTKCGSGIAPPTGVGDRLILTSRRAKSAVDYQGTVGYSLRSVAPKGKRAFFPLRKACQLRELKKRKKITERVLVTCIVRRRNSGRAKGIVIQLSDDAVLGIIHGKVHHPGAKIPSDLFCLGNIITVLRNFIKSQCVTKQGRPDSLSML